MLRPDGTSKVCTATQYLTTTYITYTTIAGDITVSGDYKFHTYVEWGGGISPKTGENVTVHVYSSTDTLPGEYELIEVIEAVTDLSVQTQAQSEALTNLSASLLYNTSSRRQGNFSIFYRMAQSRLNRDLLELGITLNEDDTKLAYAYLIQFMYERKFKDYNATQISSGGDSVTRPSASALQSYMDVLENAQAVDSTIERHTDYTNYPTQWKNTQDLSPTDEIPIE